MEVSMCLADAKCYPRFYNARNRLGEINTRLNKTWYDTFEEPYSAKVHDAEIEKDIGNKDIQMFLCDQNETKKISQKRDIKLVLQDHGITHLGSDKYADFETFLHEKQDLFNSTTVLIFSDNKNIFKTIRNVSSKPIIIIISDKQKRYPFLKTCTNVKVSSYENIANDICLMLERTAFKPLKDKFESIRSVLNQDGSKPISQTGKGYIDISKDLTLRKETAATGISTDNPISVNGNYMVHHQTNTRSKDNRGVLAETLCNNNNTLPRQSIILAEYCLNYSDRDNSENDLTYVRKTRSGKLLDKIEESECLPEKVSSTFANSSCFQRNQIRMGTKRKHEDVTATTTPDDSSTVANSSISQHKQSQIGTKRKHSDFTTTIPNECKNIPDCTKGGFDNWNHKWLENKPTFQRLLGEMTGMYKRSKIPEDLKPSLDGVPKEFVSQKMMSDLYNVSESIKGYAYRFGTRLQIFVVEADIEKLKPKVAEILEMYGITQGSYDIVPPIDTVTPYSKLHVGAQVKLNDKNYGSLSGFVIMQRGHKSVDSCAVASKHLLDGRKTVDLANEKVKITADVVPETAPGDNCMEFDIAVAKVRKDDEKHCLGQFRNESGTFMKGMVCSYDDEQLQCQYVHIYGASTEKGLGIISMTHFEERKENEESNPNKKPNGNDRSSQNREHKGTEELNQTNERKEDEELNLNKELKDDEEPNQNEKFIVVEDRLEGVSFCKEGDSGSMVCADDEDGNHVELISTVIGKRENVSYQTLRLTKGIKHLEKQTTSRIKFFE